jgi:hypothetical protein
VFALPTSSTYDSSHTSLEQEVTVPFAWLVSSSRSISELRIPDYNTNDYHTNLMDQIVMHRTIARQRPVKHIPVGASAQQLVNWSIVTPKTMRDNTTRCFQLGPCKVVMRRNSEADSCRVGSSFETPANQDMSLGAE